MGADIHVRVEYQPFVDGQWHDGDFYKRNPYYGKDGHDDELEFEREGICEERDYFRFALLADVRNDGRIRPISEPKGVPVDACASVVDDMEYWGDDGHSHSYFTLRELMDWYASNSKQVFTVTGFISPEAAVALDTKGEIPTMWCGWTSNKEWAKRTWKMEVDKIGPVIESLKRRGEELLYWGSKYDFEKDERKIPDRIRIVFWFDN